MADTREQIRIRLPSELLNELRRHGNLNDQIVSQLRMARLNRQAMMANAMTRAIGLCFVSAETVTGKRVDKDKETLKLALEMTLHMTSYFNRLVEAPPQKTTAHRLFEALSKVAFLEGDRQQAILAGFSFAAA
jgi:hypothetical protein